MSTINKINVGGTTYDLPGTEYTAGNGIDITDGVISNTISDYGFSGGLNLDPETNEVTVNPDDSTIGITSGQLCVKISGNTGNALSTVSDGLFVSNSGGSGTTYTAGTGISIVDGTISATGETTDSGLVYDAINQSIIRTDNPYKTGIELGRGAVDLQSYCYDNQGAVGDNSFVAGYYNTSSGEASVSFGNNCNNPFSTAVATNSYATVSSGGILDTEVIAHAGKVAKTLTSEVVSSTFYENYPIMDFSDMLFNGLLDVHIIYHTFGNEMILYKETLYIVNNEIVKVSGTESSTETDPSTYLWDGTTTSRLYITGGKLCHVGTTAIDIIQIGIDYTCLAAIEEGSTYYDEDSYYSDGGYSY